MAAFTRVLVTLSLVERVAMFRTGLPKVVRRAAAPLRCMSEDGASGSVTGTVYEAADSAAPVVKLFTKSGCTLCDKVNWPLLPSHGCHFDKLSCGVEVKDVLKECYGEAPHTLLSVDITDEDKKEYWDKVRPLSWASLDR